MAMNEIVLQFHVNEVSQQSAQLRLVAIAREQFIIDFNIVAPASCNLLTSNIAHIEVAAQSPHHSVFFV